MAGLGLLIALGSVAGSAASEHEALLRKIKSVGPKGQGHAAAQAALRELTACGPDALLPILAACDDANPLAMNWLRSAFEAIGDRTLHGGGELPQAALEEFVRDRSHASRARRLAYEWLCRVDPTAPDRLIPGMLDDPGEEFRRDAVTRQIAAARKAEEVGEVQRAREIWRRALDGAVHEDQVSTIVAALEAQGEPVDLIRHFGLLVEWSLIGPFDNREMKGFDIAYPPEREVDLQAQYEGQLGPVAWRPCRSDKPDGLVDIAELVFNHKGSVMYATTTFVSEQARDVEFRLATPNAWKLWLNGRLLFAHEEYHRGMWFDQYRVPGRLQEGENVILLKIHQNEQDEDWAQAYQFKFRVTDASGKAIHSSSVRRVSRLEDRLPEAP